MTSDEYKKIFSEFILNKCTQVYEALRPFYAERGATDDSLSYFRNHFDRFEKMIEVIEKNCLDISSISEVGSFYPYVSYYFNREYGIKPIDLYDIILNELGNPCEPYDVDGVKLINYNVCLQKLSATNKKYDLVICSEIMEHLPINMFEFEKDLLSIINPNKYLLATFPLGGRNAQGYELNLNRNLNRLQEDHVREYTADTTNLFFTDLKLIESVVIKAKAYGRIRICLYQT